MRLLHISLAFGLLLAFNDARGQSNFVLFVSYPGDVIGREATDMSVDPTNFIVSGSLSAIQVSALNRYRVSLGSPSGENLTVGEYTNAVHYPDNGSLPGLDVANTKLGVYCTASCGNFLIKEIHAATNGQIDRLWVTFTNWCQCSSTGAITGEVRFNSTLAEQADLYVNCPSNVTVVAPFEQNSAVVTYPAPEGTPGAWIRCYPASGSVFSAGTNQVYVYLDYGTNTIGCNFSVIVQVRPFITVTLQKQPDYPFYQAPVSLPLWAIGNSDAFDPVTNVTFVSQTNLLEVVPNPQPIGGLASFGAQYYRTFPAGYYTLKAIAQSAFGLTATSEVATVWVRTNVLTNGGFEAASFTGWTLTGSPPAPGGGLYNAVFSGWSAPVVHSGKYGVYLGDIKPATLSQALSTSSGQYYLLSFWLENPYAGTNQLFNLNWHTGSEESDVILNFTNPPAFPWTKFQSLVMATDTNAVLEIKGENDPGYFGLDDIYLTPIPLPKFETTGVSTNGFQLSWFTAPGVAYQVQYKTNLAEPNWTDLVPSFVATGNSSSAVDTNSTGSTEKYYRLVLP